MKTKYVETWEITNTFYEVQRKEGDHFSRVLVYNTSCVILKRNVTELENVSRNHCCLCVGNKEFRTTE